MKVSQEVAEFLESVSGPGQQIVETPLGKRMLVGVSTGCEGCGGFGFGPHACPGRPNRPDRDFTEFNLLLEAPGEAVVLTYKAIREITGLGLKESKDLVDEIPTRGARYLKEGISKQDAEEFAAKLEAAGARARIEPCPPSPPEVNMPSFGGPIG